MQGHSSFYGVTVLLSQWLQNNQEDCFYLTRSLLLAEAAY